MYLFRPPSHWNWAWISFAGPDAQDFLHRMSTADVKRLDVGKGLETCVLTADGRVKGYFRLWRCGLEEFAIEMEGGENRRWIEILRDHFELFTFRENLSWTENEPQEGPLWIFLDPEEPSPFQPAEENTIGVTDTGKRVCFHGSRAFGKAWVSVWGSSDLVEKWEGQWIEPEEVEHWRLSQLTPRIGREITEDTLPPELGLMHTVSSARGCYPGHEAIEKVTATTSPPRRLVLIEGAGGNSSLPLAATGDPVLNLAEPPSEVGVFTSVLQMPSRFLGLALVRKIHAKVGLPVYGGTILRVSNYE